MREDSTTLESQFSTFKDSQGSQPLEHAAALLVPTLHFRNICGGNHTPHSVISEKRKLNGTSLQSGRAEASRALRCRVQRNDLQSAGTQLPLE